MSRYLLILAVLVLLTYLSALPGHFIWTDQSYLVAGEQRVQSWQDLGDLLRLTADQFRARLDGPPPAPGSGSWEATTTLDYSLGWTLWGKCASCFRVEGVLWHLLTVIGLYALGRNLLALQRRGARTALWAAMLFAVHSIGVSLIPASNGRPVLIATALALWSLVLFTRLPATSHSHRKHVLRWLIGMLVLFAAALGASEVALVTPPVALLLAWFASQERDRPGLRGISSQRQLALVLLFALAGALVLYRILAFGGLGWSGDYPGHSTFDSLGTALRLFWEYVERTLLPGEPILTDAWPVSRGWQAGELAALLGVILWLALTGMGLWRRHPAALGSAWFLLWSLPGSGLLPVERYYSEAALYPAAWGLAFAIVYLLMQLWRPVGRQLAHGSEVVMFGPMLLVLIAFTALSNVRFWDDRGLFESEVDNDPHYVEGRSILARVALAEGRHSDAMNQAMNSIEAAKDQRFTSFFPRFEVYRLLAEAQLALALYPEAEGSYRVAIEARPTSASAHFGRARARIAQNDHAGAESDLEQALALRPDYPAARADLGIVLIAQGKMTEGLARLEAGLADGFDDHRRRSAMAEAYIAQANWTAARDALEAALRHKETAHERATLAKVQWQLGERAQARESISMALQLEETSSDYVLSISRQLSADD